MAVQVNLYDVDINSRRFINKSAGGYGLDDQDKARLYFNEQIIWGS